MTLIISGDITLRRTWQPMDPDAAAYITAVETADGQTLEQPVKIAIDNFVLGCKADGIWNAIKASCILAGARTLNGALQPLVGPAPTNPGVVFVSADYARKTGLKGNGSTKYLDSNRASDADPQNLTHHSVYLSFAGTTTLNRTHIGTEYTTNNADLNDSLALNDNRLIIRSRNANTGSNIFAAPAGSATGLMGASRSSSIGFSLRFSGSSYLASNLQSFPPSAATYTIFARNQQPPSLFSDARIAFYSIGEALDLALLDARVTDLINKFAEVIP